MKSLVEFIEKFRPGFSKEIVPADRYDIAILEEDAGPLPGVYRRFLETMGASMGALELAEASFTIDAALNAYSFPWMKGGRYVFLANDNGLSSRHWFLDRLSPHGTDDCWVVRRVLAENNPPEASVPKYVGLEEFLYYEAFKELRLPQLPFRRRLSSPGDPKAAADYRSDSVTALAEEKGFKRIPPAEHCALFERGDAAILLYRHPTQPTFSFVVGCEDVAEAERLARDFEMKTGLKGIVTR